MSEELKKFIAWLESDLTHFVSIVEEGSVVAGDPWQEGFSDHDLNVIVSQDTQSESQAIFNFLSDNPLGNEYLVGVRLAEEFLKGDSLNDISLKFRTKSLAGDDVVAKKRTPSQEIAYQIGREGLSNLTKRLERRWLNLAHWTTDYSQKKNYEIFKNFFVFLAAMHYGKTGDYPTTRADVARLLSDQDDVKLLLETTNGIGKASKSQQKQAIEVAILLIDEILGKEQF